MVELEVPAMVHVSASCYFSITSTLIPAYITFQASNYQPKKGHSCRQYPLCFRDGWSRPGYRSRKPEITSTTPKRYIDALAWLSEADRRKIYEGNARKVYKRLKVSAR